MYVDLAIIFLINQKINKSLALNTSTFPSDLYFNILIKHIWNTHSTAELTEILGNIQNQLNV